MGVASSWSNLFINLFWEKLFNSILENHNILYTDLKLLVTYSRFLRDQDIPNQTLNDLFFYSHVRFVLLLIYSYH